MGKISHKINVTLHITLEANERLRRLADQAGTSRSEYVAKLLADADGIHVKPDAAPSTARNNYVNKRPAPVNRFPIPKSAANKPVKDADTITYADIDD